MGLFLETSEAIDSQFVKSDVTPQVCVKVRNSGIRVGLGSVLKIGYVV